MALSLENTCTGRFCSLRTCPTATYLYYELLASSYEIVAGIPTLGGRRGKNFPSYRIRTELLA